MASTVNKWLPLISSMIPAYLALWASPFIRAGALSTVANTIRLVTLELEGVFSSSWEEREKSSNPVLMYQVFSTENSWRNQCLLIVSL